MKRIFCLMAVLFLCVSSVSAQTNQRIGETIIWGYTPNYPAGGMNTAALSATGTWTDTGVVLRTTKTLNKVKLYLSAVSNSPIAADASLELQADTGNGVASGTSLETEVASGVPTAAAWNEWTGFTTSMTAGTRYHFVLKNLNGTPATNHFTHQFLGTSGSGGIGSTTIASNNYSWGWSVRSSTDSGTTWSSTGGGAAAIRLEFSDGSFAGFPVQNLGLDNSNISYGTREVGTYVVTPSAQPTMRVIGVTFPIQRGSTPGDLRYRVYTGASPSLLATTYTATAGNVNDGERWTALMFVGGVQTIAANTIIRVVAGTVSGGDGSNYWRNYKYTIENNANSKALTPFGTSKLTYFDGSTWAETDTAFFPFGLILDPDQPFAASGGSSVENNNGNTDGNLQ